jgi:hypothetical protein
VTLGGNTVAGTPILTITNVPQQVPIGGGATLINPSVTNIILSTDSIATPSNSFDLAPNGAALPIVNGPLWASTLGTVAQMLVIPEILNVFNPNVLAAPLVTLDVLGSQGFTYNTIANPSGVIMPFVIITSNITFWLAQNNYASVDVVVINQSNATLATITCGIISTFGPGTFNQLLTPTQTQTMVNTPQLPNGALQPMVAFRFPISILAGSHVNMSLNCNQAIQLGVEVWGSNP